MSPFTSGNPTAKSDCMVTYEPATSGELVLEVSSKVEALYGETILRDAKQTIATLGISHGKFTIVDQGALPFVMMARIEAAVKKADPKFTKTALPPLQPFCIYPSSREKFRRSRLYLPGDQPKLMFNAGVHKPDGIILDLEDSVAPSEKLSARLIVRNALRSVDFFGCERMVRINQGEPGLADLEAVIPEYVHLILIPKVETADQLKVVDAKIAEICKQCGRTEPVFLMPILESALGILNALSIATASANNVALAIGLEDYTADICSQKTLEGRESFFARSMIVNAARAAGIQPIDTVFSDVNDMEGLKASVMEAKSLGFDGKGCIHPRQIGPIHEAFAPSTSEIEKAKKIVLAFDDAQKRGLGVVSLGSKMIDPPVVKRAEHTIKLAIATGILASNWKETVNS